MPRPGGQQRSPRIGNHADAACQGQHDEADPDQQGIYAEPVAQRTGEPTAWAASGALEARQLGMQGA